MEATTSNEDVLVVLQTENGEEIALPMSALPDDFVPGDSGQIIMVESPLDEQQEVVVESSAEPQTKIITESDKPVPRTYSKIKSYAPTCGTTRIYQQSTNNSHNTESSPQDSDIKLENESTTTTITTTTNNNTTVNTTVNTTTTSLTSTSSTTAFTDPQMNAQSSFIPRKKQKRKETLLTKSFNEGDMEFQFIDEPLDEPQAREVERKPRKEYRTKKKRLALLEAKKDEETREDSKREESKKEEPEKGEEIREEPKKVKEISEEPEKTEVKRKLKEKPSVEPVKPQPQLHQTERRTRLSNACRVATGKSYRCNDCDFSTDRINNIILHVKESCPKIKAR